MAREIEHEVANLNEFQGKKEEQREERSKRVS